MCYFCGDFRFELEQNINIIKHHFNHEEIAIFMRDGFIRLTSNGDSSNQKTRAFD